MPYSLIHSLTDKLRRYLKRKGFRIMRARNCPQGTDALLYKDLAAFLQRAGKPFVMLDIGANTGEFSKAFLESVPQAIIHCFEPSPDVFRSLSKRYKADPRVTCHHQAVGESTGKMAFEMRPDDNTLGRLVEKAGEGTCPVEVTTVDVVADALDAPYIALLKTDTEGNELQVLSGAARTLDQNRILAILVEVTLGDTTERHISLNQVSRVLVPHGFTLSGVYDIGYDRHTGATRFCNALFKSRALSS